MIQLNGQDFENHRDKFIKTFQSHGFKSECIIIHSLKLTLESYTTDEISFSQEPLFYWLTGWKNPDSILIINLFDESTILFTQNYTEDYELFTGPKPTHEFIEKITHIKNIKENKEFNFYKNQIKNPILELFPKDSTNLNENEKIILTIASICRRIKDKNEIEACRIASTITSNAIIEVMKNCKPNIKEKYLESIFLFNSTINGGEGYSFPPIIASGYHSSYLHYIENNDIIPNNSLVLVDLGIKYENYCGDISRTFPSNGKFLEEQKLIYNLLLKCQESIISIIGPYKHLHFLQETTEKLIFNILKDLKLLKEFLPFNENIVSLFFPHGVSHHIGLNNHDLCYIDDSPLDDDYYTSTYLLPNMIISCEPGIYFQKDKLLKIKNSNLKYSKYLNWDNIFHMCNFVSGIRIEDDILITENGNEVLSNCPKKIEEIEKLMNYQG